MRALFCMMVCVAAFNCSEQESNSPGIAAFETAAKAMRPDARRRESACALEFEGRAAGSHGYDVAAKYVAAQLEALSLQPAGERGTWFQDVPMRKSVNIAEQSSVTFFRNGK